MIEADKFYNRNKLSISSGLSYRTVDDLVSDIEPIKIGKRKIYRGVDILQKLTPKGIKNDD